MPTQLSIIVVVLVGSTPTEAIHPRTTNGNNR